MGAVEVQHDSFLNLAPHGFECIVARSREFISEEVFPGPFGYSEILDVFRNIHLLDSGSVITGLNFSD
jgi:hypothetical protein